MYIQLLLARMLGSIGCAIERRSKSLTVCKWAGTSSNSTSIYQLCIYELVRLAKFDGRGNGALSSDTIILCLCLSVSVSFLRFFVLDDECVRRVQRARRPTGKLRGSWGAALLHCGPLQARLSDKLFTVLYAKHRYKRGLVGRKL